MKKTLLISYLIFVWAFANIANAQQEVTATTAQNGDSKNATGKTRPFDFF